MWTFQFDLNEGTVRKGEKMCQALLIVWVKQSFSGEQTRRSFLSKNYYSHICLQICHRSGKMGQRINSLVVLLKIISGTSENYSSSSRQMKRCFTCLIISMTKISIVIGSLCAYLSRNRRAITWVSNSLSQSKVMQWKNHSLDKVKKLWRYIENN